MWTQILDQNHFMSTDCDERFHSWSQNIFALSFCLEFNSDRQICTIDKLQAVIKALTFERRDSQRFQNGGIST